MMRRVLLLALVACGGSHKPASKPVVIAQEAPPDAAPAPEPEHTEPQVLDTEPPPPDDTPPPGPTTISVPTTTPTITMVSKGAKKHRARLAFALTAGSEQTIDMSMTMTAVYLKNNVVMPAMVMTMKTDVGDVGSDGSAKLESTVTNVAANDVPNETMSSSQALTSYQKTQGTIWNETMAPDGSVSDMTITIPVGGMKQQQQQQIAVAFPSDAVGVGAKWTASLQTVFSGLQVQLATNYTLKSRKGSVAVIDVDEAMTIPPQTYQQNGMTMNLSKGTVTAKGELIVDQSKPLPLGQFTMHEDFAMSAMGQAVTMTVDLAMAMTAK